VKITRSVIALLFIVVCCRGADQADDALNEARELAREGRFEEALQKHIWYHDHALEINPAHYGVRLSYALSDWVELGRKYPKALDALKAIRDQKAKRLTGGESEHLIRGHECETRTLFHEVASINHYLGESRATVELFKNIEAAQLDFATSIADLADEALFEAKEYAVERKYLGDPFAKFEAAKRVFDDGREYAKTSGMPERSRQAFEIIFTKDIVRLIVVLDKTGDGAAARQIQSKALAICSRPEIKNALE
jgi:hypothetical protein